VNGNVNGQKAHWKEGEFLPYRATVSGLAAGAHTLDFHYDTVHGSKHALDYLGSFDATETTSSTATALHANNNDPCGDVLSSGCTPSSPHASAAIPGAPTTALVNCGGSAGTAPTLASSPGSIKLFGTAVTGSATFSYLAQNTPSGNGQCSTSARVSFSTTGTDQTIVIAWGAHIASEVTWGAGNSASAISGSPYHMALDALDGASTGSQDRALSTSAIIFGPTIATQLKDANGTNVTTTTVGATVHDTATLTGASSNAGGSVDYRYYTSQTACQTDASAFPGTAPTGGTNVGSVTVTNGVVPQSAPVTLNTAGTIYWAAFYSGDNGPPVNLPAVSDCSTEVLTIGKASPTITTSLNAGTIDVGTSTFDTATLHGATSNAGGTVDYRYYATQAACQTDADAFPGTAPTGGTNVGSVTVTNGSVPQSASATFNTAGDYYWAAFYSGDANNNAAVSGCATELLVVNKLGPTITTSLNAGTIDVGTSTFDTATLHGATSNAGGTVDYRYYATQAACQTDAAAFPGTAPTGGTNVGSVTVTSGVVPQPARATFTPAVDYYWAAFTRATPTMSPRSVAAGLSYSS